MRFLLQKLIGRRYVTTAIASDIWEVADKADEFSRIVTVEGDGNPVHSYDPTAPFDALRSAYHPDYGLDDGTRLEAVRLVVHWRVSVKETARLCRVHPATVYNWLKAAGQPAPRFADKKDT